MQFPVYRKYINGMSLFKITSYERFQEIKTTGSKTDLHYFQAKIHPDRMLIKDMLEMKDGHWIESSAEEFELGRPAND